MYGKLDNGVLIYAPKRLTLEDGVHYHPTAEMYEDKGYLPIVETPYPETEEEKYYTPHWEQTDGRIVQVWIEETEQEIVIKPSREVVE